MARDFDESGDDADYPAEMEESFAILFAGQAAGRSHPGMEPRRLIRCLRRARGLSQGYLAEAAGIRQARVSEIENDGPSPRWSETAALLDAMGLEPLLLARGRGPAAKGRR